MNLQEDVTSTLNDEESKIFMRLISSIETQIDQGQSPREAFYLTMTSFYMRQLNQDKSFSDKELFNAIKVVISDVKDRFNVFL